MPPGPARGGSLSPVIVGATAVLAAGLRQLGRAPASDTAFDTITLKTDGDTARFAAAAVAHGMGDNLLTRAADVTLKERRRLVLMVRETPFNLAHLRNMTAVTEMGGIVFPPLPAFYHRPQSIDELVSETVERVLALLQIEQAHPQEWQGL